MEPSPLTFAPNKFRVASAVCVDLSLAPVPAENRTTSALELEVQFITLDKPKAKAITKTLDMVTKQALKYAIVFLQLLLLSLLLKTCRKLPLLCGFAFSCVHSRRTYYFLVADTRSHDRSHEHSRYLFREIGLNNQEKNGRLYKTTEVQCPQSARSLNS